MHWIYIALFPRPSKTLYIEGGDLTHHHQCVAPTRGHLHFELEIRGNVKEITLWSEYITCEQPWNSFCSSESKEHRRHFLHSAGLGIVTPVRSVSCSLSLSDRLWLDAFWGLVAADRNAFLRYALQVSCQRAWLLTLPFLLRLVSK